MSASVTVYCVCPAPIEFHAPVCIPTNVEYPTGLSKNSCAIISYPSADVRPIFAVSAGGNVNCKYMV